MPLPDHSQHVCPLQSVINACSQTLTLNAASEPLNVGSEPEASFHTKPTDGYSDAMCDTSIFGGPMLCRGGIRSGYCQQPLTLSIEFACGDLG